MLFDVCYCGKVRAVLTEQGYKEGADYKIETANERYLMRVKAVKPEVKLPLDTADLRL